MNSLETLLEKILANLDDAARKKIIDSSYAELHFGIGMAIRNMLYPLPQEDVVALVDCLWEKYADYETERVLGDRPDPDADINFRRIHKLLLTVELDSLSCLIVHALKEHLSGEA